jgi:hypothetical protein
MDGGGLTDSAAADGADFTAPHAAANSRAAAVRSARSNRLRQRGHQDGAPARREPQLGHASIPDSVGTPEENLNLKRDHLEVDSTRVNVVLVPALLLLVGVVVYKKIIEPKRGQTKSTSATTSETPQPTSEKKPRKTESKRQEVAKARASGSGRMGSVL